MVVNLPDATRPDEACLDAHSNGLRAERQTYSGNNLHAWTG